MSKTMMTRKGFLGAAAGGTILLLLQACGGGDDDAAPATNTGGGTTPSKTCGANGTAIAGNHGHVLSIPAADLDSSTDKTYSIQGSSGHDHLVTLTVAQLQALKAGQMVSATSTTDFQHNHVVTVSCV